MLGLKDTKTCPSLSKGTGTENREHKKPIIAHSAIHAEIMAQGVEQRQWIES